MFAIFKRVFVFHEIQREQWRWKGGGGIKQLFRTLIIERYIHESVKSIRWPTIHQTKFLLQPIEWITIQMSEQTYRQYAGDYMLSIGGTR